MVRIICLSSFSKEIPEIIDRNYFKLMTMNRITRLDNEYKTSKKITNASETFNIYALTEICIGYDFIEDYDFYLNDIKKKVYLMYIYRNDTSLLVIPMEKGAVKFRQIKNGIYEIIILSSKLYDLSFDLRLKIRHIKTTEVRGFSKEEENYYLKYAKTIENFNGENKEDAFARTKFKLPNKSEPNVLRTKISDLRTLIELLCNPETGDHDNVPIDKRYHQQVNSLLMPTEAWRVHKPRSTTFNKQINTYRQIREIRWSKVDLQKYDFENIDADNVEKIQFENMKIFDNKKELPKCFQNMEFENLTTLIYKYCKIIEISDEIAQKLPVTLKELDLSFNNITSISIDISRLTKLEILCLDNNLLLTTPRIPWKSLPSSILQLYLKFTSIAEIPDEIQNLVNLQHLSIGSWCLMNISWKNISKSIRKIYVESAVIINEIELNDKCNLEKLSIEKAVLREINCSCLPDQLIELNLNYTLLTKFTCKNAIPNVQHLCLSFNSLASIPWEDLPPTLITFGVRNNLIKSIENILHLINLTSLDLQYNEIEELPTDIVFLRSLEVINIENNLLASLPIGFENLRNLSKMLLGGNRFNYEYGNINENLWKRLPSKMEQLILDHNNLGELPCHLRNIKILSLSVENCGLQYICPYLITERRETQYGFILNISNNPKLTNLSIIPTAIYQSLSSTTNSSTKPSSFIMVTNDDKFLEKTRKKVLYEFNKSENYGKEKPSFWCKCCVSCGNETLGKIIKQLMIMDFYLNIETKIEKIINIHTFSHITTVRRTEQELSSGKWKTNVITQLCQLCQNGLLKKINAFNETISILRCIDRKPTKKKKKIESDENEIFNFQRCINASSSLSPNKQISSYDSYDSSKATINQPLQTGSLLTLPLPPQSSNIELNVQNCLTTPTLMNDYLKPSANNESNEINQCYVRNNGQIEYNNNRMIVDGSNYASDGFDNQEGQNYQQTYYGNHSWIKEDNNIVYLPPNKMDTNAFQQNYNVNSWIKEPQAISDEYNLPKMLYGVEHDRFSHPTNQSNHNIFFNNKEMQESNNTDLQILNITNVHANHPIYAYYPPTISWLRNACLEFGIPFYVSIFAEAFFVEDLFFYCPDKTIKTIGDGHCGFYSLSILLCGYPTSHDKLRAIIANHIINSPINLESFVWWEDARLIAYKDLETDTTKCTDNWMRSIHLAAAADLLQCNILVKGQDRYGWECYNFTTFNYGRNNTVFRAELPCLLMDNSSGNHFEPVITVKQIN